MSVPTTTIQYLENMQKTCALASNFASAAAPLATASSFSNTALIKEGLESAIDPKVLKEGAIKELSRVLNLGIIPKKFQKLVHQGAQYMLSNEDYKKHKILEQLKQWLNDKTKMTKAIKVGMFLGGAHVPSNLPELAALDIILFFDVNAYPLTHNKLLIDLLLRCNNISDFKAQYRSTIDSLDWPKNVKQSCFAQLFVKQRELVGVEHFFLNSEERFKQCKEACAKLTFIFHQNNFLEQNHIDELLLGLNSSNCPTRICVLSITNLPAVYSWHAGKELQSSLYKLCKDNPAILYSYRVDINSSVPARLFTCITENPSLADMLESINQATNPPTHKTVLLPNNWSEIVKAINPPPLLFNSSLQDASSATAKTATTATATPLAAATATATITATAATGLIPVQTPIPAAANIKVKSPSSY